MINVTQPFKDPIATADLARACCHKRPSFKLSKPHLGMPNQRNSLLRFRKVIQMGNASLQRETASATTMD